MNTIDSSQIKILLGTYGVTTMSALTNPAIHKKVQEYRRSAGRMIALDKEGMNEKVPEEEFHVSRKIDGEFAVLVMNEDEIFLINPGGTIRTGLPLMQEARKCLEEHGIHNAVIPGEFYKREDGKRERVHDVAHVARKPDSEKDLGLLHFAVFDIMEIDNKPVDIPFDEVWAKITGIFASGTLIHPVESVKVRDSEELNKIFENWVEKENAEGLVLRSDTAGMFKIKPRHFLDVVVVGFTEGTEDRTGMIHDILVAVMREEGTLHLLGRVGSGLTDEQRRTFLSDLMDITAESEYNEINSDRVAYQMVRPELIIEISCLDLISQNTRGRTIDRMVLNWNEREGRYETVRNMPMASIISPQFIRYREDKTVNPSDLRMKQVTDIVDVPHADKNSLQICFPKSKILRRKVCTKVMKGATMVRKLVLWKTNKDTESDHYPAYVVYSTDFSPNRNTPISRDIRVSNSEKQIKSLWEAMEKKYFIKGWEEVIYG
jgi:ATP-dependent DNA ligase